jgi:Methyltransferase FkbM domain
MNVTPGSSKSNSLRSIASSTGSVEVTIDTLDSFCDSRGIDLIDLLKNDVEGFELPVLQGAKRHLSSGTIRYIYVECVFAPNTEMPHTSFFGLRQFLPQRGFCFLLRGKLQLAPGLYAGQRSLCISWTSGGVCPGNLVILARARVA